MEYTIKRYEEDMKKKTQQSLTGELESSSSTLENLDAQAMESSISMISNRELTAKKLAAA